MRGEVANSDDGFHPVDPRSPLYARTHAIHRIQVGPNALPDLLFPQTLEEANLSFPEAPHINHQLHELRSQDHHLRFFSF